MSNGNNGFTPTPRVKNAFDIAKLKITAPTPGNPGTKSSLQLTLVNNNPRFLVWTNDPTEKDDKNKGYGKITAPLDPVVLSAYWQMLKEVTNAPGKVKYAIQNKGHKFFGGQRSDAPVGLNNLICGKEEDGVIWTMVSEKGRPQIRFDFRLPEYHIIMGADGAPVDVAVESRMVANGWMELMGRLMVTMIADNYVEPPPRDNNRNGGGGGFNRGGNGGGGGFNRGGGGGGAPAAGNDGDDIPF